MENSSLNNTPFLSVRNLVVEYTSEGDIIHAVNDVSFDLEKGRTLALVGETGAGKTTIAKSIIGILPDPPARVKGGEIFIEGEDVLKLSEKEMQRIRGNKVSMIFQDPMTALNPVMRVGEQIAEVIRQHNSITKKESLERAAEMLEMVGISRDRMMEYPHQFSGGMKQRVVIAIGLACSPGLLLADEPTTALDVTIQAQVLDMINRLKTELNTAMIMITHDLGVVAEVADSVAVVYAGEVIEYGTKEQLFDTPRHPYTNGLFASLPDLSRDMRRLNPIVGLPPDPTSLPEGCNFSPRCPYATDECRKSHPAKRDIGNGHLVACHIATKEDE